MFLRFSFHVKNNLQAKFNSVEDRTIRAKIITDLFLEQLTQTPDIFTVASSLFLKNGRKKLKKTNTKKYK